MKTTAKQAGRPKIPKPESPVRCLECTNLFTSHASFRDHLPCSGTASPELIAWREANGAHGRHLVKT
jgi:hypothetical protein